MGSAAIRHRLLDVEGGTIHVAEAGDAWRPAILCLHGWPESWCAFEALMDELQHDAHVLAIDLPGIGDSTVQPAPGDKRTLAACVRNVIAALELHEVTLVGHDIGGMVAYAFLRRFPDAVARAVIMDTAIPGVAPWDEVVRNPHIWHFAFHAVPDLPETLVAGHEADYFAFFQRALSARPDDAATRARRHAQAYARASALHAGFQWYRAFERDACDNRADHGQRIGTPVLYLRGEQEKGIALDDYAEGLRASGLVDVRGGLIAASGHFAPEEQPRAVADALRAFAAH